VLTAEVDTHQMTTEQIARELLRQFRLYGFTQVIPKGQEVIRNGLEGAKLMMNMLELLPLNFIGPAINGVVFLIVTCANDAYEEMCAANFIMTTATNLIETLDWFHCFKEPFTEKLNQSWWGTLDTYSLWDMETYAVHCTAKLTDAALLPGEFSTDPVYSKEGKEERPLPFQIQTRCLTATPTLVEELVAKENRNSYIYDEQQKDPNYNYNDSKWHPLITFHFTVLGNAFSKFKTCNHTPIFENKLSNNNNNNTIDATQRNLEILYILLADEVLTTDNIQPPKLNFPIGHWTQFSKRLKHDQAKHQLLTQTYKTGHKDPDPFDFYTMLPTNKDQRHIFDVHLSNLRGKSK
ncbi:hypothetical protein EBR57_11060, partial [bacterium]|nr:hypothetical protein [bacterium]